MAFWKRREHDLDEEISSHLRMAAGDIGEEAAQRQFGNVALVREVTRQMWRFSSWEPFLQDLRYALRILGRNPAYTLIAILSLALGIGANTAIFSLIDSIMLQSLPVVHPEQLVSIGDPTSPGHVQGGTLGDGSVFSYPFYLRFREHNAIFSGVYATGRSERLNIDQSDEHPLARFVTSNYFSVLGVSPLLGRTFTESEQPVVVISYAYWARHFQRAMDVVGRDLRVNGASFTIVGVTPPGFFGDIVGYQSNLWFPVQAQPLANPGRNYLKDPKTQWLLLMGRLNSGVSLAQAAAAANSLAHAILKEQITSPTPATARELAAKKIRVQRAAGGFSRIRHTFAKPLFVLMFLVALVLLICCTNVANLQLARAISRTREIGLRLAIGASRYRLLRQLMTESLVLALAGGLAGLLVALGVARLLLGLVARDHRLPLDFQLSSTTLLFTLALSIAACLFFGLAPALYATRTTVASNLRGSRTGRSHSGTPRVEKGLVVFQIVLSWVLLFGSGLFIRTLQNLQNSDVGYVRDSLFVVEIDAVGSGYNGDRLIQLSKRLLGALQNSPGIRSATVSENGLFSGTESASGVMVPGFVPRSDDDKVSHADRVGPGYFETIGTPILAGRGIEPRDMENGPQVIVINEAMARFYFPNANPIGRRVSLDDGKTWVTVVGLVRDAKQNNLRDPAARRFYSQFVSSKDDPIGSMRLELRGQTAAGLSENLIRQRIRNVDPNLQIESISSAQALIDDELLQERLIAKLSSYFSLLALFLAGIGLYGVMTYLTQRRTTEMGIRMALGASRGGVIGMVLKETLLVTALGLAIGMIASAFLSASISSSLYGVAAFDPLTATAASCAIVAAAFLAGWLPARRAAHVDPMVALRIE